MSYYQVTCINREARSVPVTVINNVYNQFCVSVLILQCSSSRRPVGSAVYQSTGSLHSDGHSSNSMSPAPSPSPTQALAQNTMKATKISSHQQKFASQAQYATRGSLPQRPLSGSLSNLNLSTSRKWNSTSDFRDQSPLLNIRYVIMSNK